MKDIQVDSDGNFRCWNCGGRHFSEKRTRRSKVIGVGAGLALTPVAAAGILAAKKRLRCQACGEYSKMGNAQPQKPDSTPTDGRSPAKKTQDRDLADRIARQTYTPPKIAPPNPGTSRPGQFFDVKKPRRSF